MAKEKTTKKVLDEALRINERELADEIRTVGFCCKRCAECCKEEYGDNTVAVFPSEISRICEACGLERKDIVVPFQDSKGQTLGWVLRKNGDCIFLEKGLCRIYECRPYICETYPFYLIDGKLTVSECAGIGSVISDEESRKIASMLKRRYIAEMTC